MRSGPYAGGPGGRGAAGALLIPASGGKANQQLRRDAESPARPGARPRRGGDGRPRPGREAGGGHTQIAEAAPGLLNTRRSPEEVPRPGTAPGTAPQALPAPGRLRTPRRPGPPPDRSGGRSAEPQRHRRRFSCLRIPFLFSKFSLPDVAPTPPRTRKTDVNESADGGSGRGGCCGLRGGLPPPPPRPAAPGPGSQPSV